MRLPVVLISSQLSAAFATTALALLWRWRRLLRNGLFNCCAIRRVALALPPLWPLGPLAQSGVPSTAKLNCQIIQYSYQRCCAIGSDQ